jgi:L-malate glycosyltransferase
MRIVMLTGWAPAWRHPWESAARRIADVVTVRTTSSRLRGGALRTSSHEYEVPLLKVQPERLSAPVTRPWMARRYEATLDRIRAEHGPIDLLHAHFYSSALGATDLGVPFVVSEHTSAFTRPERSAIVHRSAKAAQVVYEKAATVMPVSRLLETDLRRAGLTANYRVVANPIDVDLFVAGPQGIRSDTVRVLYAGRLAQLKGLDLLIRALRGARRVVPTLQLRIAGSGPFRHELERLIKMLDLADVVELLGYVQPVALLQELRSSDMFVFPSRGESFGIPVVEALCSGIPVVASRTGIAPDIVNDGNGYLVPLDDVGDLTRAMCALAESRTRFEPAEVSAGIAAQFSPAAIADQLALVYEDALSRRS